MRGARGLTRVGASPLTIVGAISLTIVGAGLLTIVGAGLSARVGASALQTPANIPAGVRAVVAADGTGDYRTVQEAINAVPQNTSSSNRWIIFIKAGTYRELIYVQREKRYVTLVGEDAVRT